MSAEHEALDGNQYLTFFLAGEEYAISILRVKEIIVYGTLTKVPTMPAFVRGVINLRGSVVPVMDLGIKLGMSESPVTQCTCIIIVEVEWEGEQTVLGLVADAVNRVIDLLPDDIEPAPAFGTHVRLDYLLGMGRVGEKFALLLDIDRVLSLEELLEVDSITIAEQYLDAPKATELVSA